MTRNRMLKIALPLAAVLGAGTAVAIAAIPSASDKVIHACYTTTGTLPGQLRVVDAEASPPQTCTPDEATLTWNQAGPAGPTGPQGPDGEPGLPGLDATGTSSGSSGGGTSNFSPTEAGGPSADIFVKLDGIAGDSTDEKHKGEIEAEAFAYAVKTKAKVGTPTVRIDKVYDSSSPKLLAASINHHKIKSAVITFRLSSGTSTSAFLTYKLSDVTVVGYQQGGANPDTKPLGSLEEEVALTAAKAQVTERTVDDKGNPGPTISTSVDLKEKKQH
jgi:type VI secretion system secreted protein Hcp